MFDNTESFEKLFQEFIVIMEKYLILFLNLMLFSLLPICVYKCHKEIYPFINKSKAITFAVIVSLANNISYIHDSLFINFRIISQIFVLLSYYYSLNNQYVISSIVSFLALIVDKTNIFWVFFIIFSKIYYILYFFSNSKHKMNKFSSFGEILNILKSLNIQRYKKYLLSVIIPYILSSTTYYVLRILLCITKFEKKFLNNQIVSSTTDFNNTIYLFSVVLIYSINSIDLVILKKDLKYLYKRYFTRNILSLLVLFLALFWLIIKNHISITIDLKNDTDLTKVLLYLFTFCFTSMLVYKKSILWCILFLISTLGYIIYNNSLYSLYYKLIIPYILYRINIQQNINIEMIIAECIHLIVLKAVVLFN